MPDDMNTVGDLLDRTAPGPAPQAIGSNSGAVPLAEMLVEETVDLAKRADTLLKTAELAKVETDDQAADAVTLVATLKAHLKAIEEAREERKRPFLEDCRTVDSHFRGLVVGLAGAEYPKKVGGAIAAVLAMVDGWRRKKAAEAQAEEARRLEAQRKADAEAEAAATKAAISGTVKDAVVAEQAAVHAQTVAAAPPVARPIIASSTGAKAFGRKVNIVTITDLGAAAAHLVATQPDAMREFVLKRYKALADAGARSLSGAEITEDSATTIR